MGAAADCGDIGRSTDDRAQPASASARDFSCADQHSSTTVRQPRTASVARLQHAPAAAPTVPVYPDSWLGEGGYLDRLARCRGRLVSVRGERDVTLELHGLGDGLVLVRGPVAYTNGPHDLLTTLIALGAQDVFDPDGEFMSGLLSGEWDQGEVASVFARWYDLSEYGGVDFIVDDILVSTDGHGQSTKT